MLPSFLDATRTRLLELLRERSFERREVVLASGRRSDFYVDTKQTSLDAEGHLLIGRLLYAELCAYRRRTGRAPAAAGGLTLGADPLASALAMTSALAGDPIPAFIVRKEAKGHGTGAWLEGARSLAPGSELVVLEDVVTTGGSALSATQRVRAAGFRVHLVVAVMDRREGGREVLEAEGLEVVSLFDRRDFIPER